MTHLLHGAVAHTRTRAWGAWHTSYIGGCSPEINRLVGVHPRVHFHAVEPAQLFGGAGAAELPQTQGVDPGPPRGPDVGTPAGVGHVEIPQRSREAVRRRSRAATVGRIHDEDAQNGLPRHSAYATQAQLA